MKSTPFKWPQATNQLLSCASESVYCTHHTHSHTHITHTHTLPQLCSNGIGRTGVFITVHAQLERLKIEGVVDVFQFVKSIRKQREDLVPTVVSCSS